MKQATDTRTDAHRPSTIIPADYEHLHEFGRVLLVPASESLTGEREEEWEGMEYALDLYGADGAYVHGSRDDVADAILRCDACGARYAYGALFRHAPTGQVVSMGHDCADALDLAYDVARARGIREQAARIRKARLDRSVRFRELRGFAREAGRELLEALRFDHRITRDIRERLIRRPRYGLSHRQRQLVLKLAAEGPRVEEVLVAAPIADGRQTVEGRVVSVKLHEGYYGDTLKVTVKVETPAGAWLAWGTLPAALVEAAWDEHEERRRELVRAVADGDDAARLEHAAHSERADGGTPSLLRGRRVRFDAKLKAGREEHFAIFSRPTKPALLAPAEGASS